MKRLAIFESVIAGALWGFGFLATVWAMKEINPFALTFSRFALASLLLIPIALRADGRAHIKSYVRMAFWPGVLFAGTLLVQTWGLTYTTATKSGFITTLYVVFMPMLESTLSRKPLGKKLWVSVGLAFLGTLMIVNIGLSELNLGDLLTLSCALFATVQIYYVGRISHRIHEPFTYNLVQAAWAAVICLPFAFDRVYLNRLAHFADWPFTAQIGLIGLGYGSTVIAFGLQVRAQKVLSPTLSSLLFLLESPFAMILAVIFLGERSSPLEVYGALLIFLAAVLACLPSPRKDSLLIEVKS